jgi:hypothetical protein
MFPVKVETIEFLSYFSDSMPIDEDLAVEVPQQFPDKDVVCEHLMLHVVEEKEEGLVIAVEHREYQVTFEVRRELSVKPIMLLERLHHTCSKTVLNILDGVIVNIPIQRLVRA